MLLKCHLLRNSKDILFEIIKDNPANFFLPNFNKCIIGGKSATNQLIQTYSSSVF